MCGIFGVTQNLISEDLAYECLNKLYHRGPDGYGLWQSDGVTLGHRRLSILDLSINGKQPMSYANERYYITFNGEIYNFIELRNELQGLGHRFITETDTEVILAAFDQWGEECLNRFNGMWAFCIWDNHTKKLFMSRDRFGKKPLFYIIYNGGIAFASEMKALFPLLERVSPNEDIIKDPYSMFKYESTEACVIKGIKRFPAGSYGWVQGNNINITKWWSTLDNLPQVHKNYDEQVEIFRALFLDACKIRMRSDVPIGTALSGGLDSSATISTMAYIANGSGGQRVSRDWQHAYVACFPNTPLDESYFAKKVTDHLGINGTFIDIDPVKEIDNLNRYFYLFEDLYITSPIPFMMTYRAIKDNGTTVTIDGHGADELFGGYPFDFINALDDVGLNVKEALSIIQTYYDCFPKDGSNLAVKFPPKLQFYLNRKIKEMARLVLKRKSIRVSSDNKHPNWNKLDELNKILYISTHDTILPTLLRNYDRYSMANSVEIRMPFMDHRIVTFAFALNWNSKIRNGYSKAIIRDAVSGFMPNEIAYRKSKIGFNSPITDWMKGPLKNFFLDHLNSQAFRECTLIDSLKVKRQIENVIDSPNATFSMGESAWTALVPYLWEQAVIKQKNI